MRVVRGQSPNPGRIPIIQGLQSIGDRHIQRHCGDLALVGRRIGVIGVHHVDLVPVSRADQQTRVGHGIGVHIGKGSDQRITERHPGMNGPVNLVALECTAKTRCAPGQRHRLQAGLRIDERHRFRHVLDRHIIQIDIVIAPVIRAGVGAETNPQVGRFGQGHLLTRPVDGGGHIKQVRPGQSAINRGLHRKRGVLNERTPDPEGQLRVDRPRRVQAVAERQVVIHPGPGIALSPGGVMRQPGPAVRIVGLHHPRGINPIGKPVLESLIKREGHRRHRRVLRNRDVVNEPTLLDIRSVTRQMKADPQVRLVLPCRQIHPPFRPVGLVARRFIKPVPSDAVRRHLHSRQVR